MAHEITHSLDWKSRDEFDLASFLVKRGMDNVYSTKKNHGFNEKSIERAGISTLMRSVSLSP